MKRFRGILLFALLALSALTAPTWAREKWQGIDETVVGRFAREAHHPPRNPYINTDQGDLLLFVFLGAGAAGGFVAGYFYRELFVSKRPPRKDADV